MKSTKRSACLVLALCISLSLSSRTAEKNLHSQTLMRKISVPAISTQSALASRAILPDSRFSLEIEHTVRKKRVAKRHTHRQRSGTNKHGRRGRGKARKGKGRTRSRGVYPKKKRGGRGGRKRDRRSKGKRRGKRRGASGKGRRRSGKGRSKHSNRRHGFSKLRITKDPTSNAKAIHIKQKINRDAATLRLWTKTWSARRLSAANFPRAFYTFCREAKAALRALVGRRTLNGIPEIIEDTANQLLDTLETFAGQVDQRVYNGMHQMLTEIGETAADIQDMAAEGGWQAAVDILIDLAAEGGLIAELAAFCAVFGV